MLKLQLLLQSLDVRFVCYLDESMQEQWTEGTAPLRKTDVTASDSDPVIAAAAVNALHVLS